MLSLLKFSLTSHSWSEVKEVLATGKEGPGKLGVMVAAVTVSEVL